MVRTFTRLKASLMPYLYKTSVETSRSGVPTMRSMVLEFTKDRNCSYLDKQYMLGDSLLVAPIFNEESIGSFYLPKGTWTDFFTGEVLAGGDWYERKYDYLHLPLMVRENSIVAMGAHDDKPDYDYADGVELRVYALVDGQRAETTVYDMQQNAALHVTVVKNGSKITLQSDGNNDKAYTIRLVNVKASDAKSAELSIDGADTVLTPTGKEIEVNL